MSTENTKLAVTTKKSAPATIRDHLTGQNFKEQLKAALTKYCSPERFVRIALTALTKTPKLAECDQASFFNALLTLSQLGLEPDGRRAHLIPFNNTKRGCVECQLIVDYKGIVELVMRSGAVSSLHADVVCENDAFEFNMGQVTRHNFKLGEPRGNEIGVYAVCRFKDGSEKAEVMSYADVELVRARSKAANSGPWVTDWAEMSKKTVFKRLSKWLNWSPEINDALAIDDEQARLDAAKPAKVVFEPVSNEPAALAAAPAPEPEDNVPMDGNAPTVAPAQPAAGKKQAASASGTAAENPLAVIRAVLESRGVTEAELVASLLKRQLITPAQLAPDGEPTMLEDIQKKAPEVITELIEYPTGLIGIIATEKARAAKGSK